MKIRLSVILCVSLGFIYLSRHFLLDDGLIYARYISNALEGKGLVFNAGESVNALTSPLFGYLLLFTSWVCRGHVLFAEKVLFAIFFLGSCFLAERLAVYSGIALSVMAYFYFLIGMESALFLFMLTLTTTAYIELRVRWLPLLMVLTLLTRFEGGLLIPIIGYHLWREKRMPRATAYVPAAAVIVFYILLNHHWYGRLLPSSVFTKIEQGFSGYWGPWPLAFLRVNLWAYGGYGIFFHTLYVIPIIAVLAFFGWRDLRGSRMNAVVVPFCTGLTAFYVLFNLSSSYYWYNAPLIFFAVIYAARGLPKDRFVLPAMAALLLMEAGLNAIVLSRTGSNTDYVEAASWIRENTPANARVASAEIGQIGWTCDRYLIDILGLTYPPNAVHIGHKDVTSWLEEDKPDYVVVHKPVWVYEKVAAESPKYVELPNHYGNVYLLQRKTEARASGE